MKVVSVYQTADGKEFKTRLDAKNHEVELESLDKIKSLLKNSLSSLAVRSGNCDGLLKHILLEHSEMRKILQRFNKRQPRPSYKRKTKVAPEKIEIK